MAFLSPKHSRPRRLPVAVAVAAAVLSPSALLLFPAVCRVTASGGSLSCSAAQL